MPTGRMLEATRRARVRGLALVPMVALLALLVSTPSTPPPIRPESAPGSAPGHSLVRGDGLLPKSPNPWFHVERSYPHGTIPIAVQQIFGQAFEHRAGDGVQPLRSVQGDGGEVLFLLDQDIAHGGSPRVESESFAQF